MNLMFSFEVLKFNFNSTWLHFTWSFHKFKTTWVIFHVDERLLRLKVWEWHILTSDFYFVSAVIFTWFETLVLKFFFQFEKGSFLNMDFCFIVVFKGFSSILKKERLLAFVFSANFVLFVFLNSSFHKHQCFFHGFPALNLKDWVSVMIGYLVTFQLWHLWTDSTGIFVVIFSCIIARRSRVNNYTHKCKYLLSSSVSLSGL